MLSVRHLNLANQTAILSPLFTGTIPAVSRTQTLKSTPITEPTEAATLRSDGEPVNRLWSKPDSKGIVSTAANN